MSLIRNAAKMAKRSFSASAAAAAGSTPSRKVAVLGAAGGIGQPLGLLMKLNPLVSDLALYDIAGTPGVAADVSHVCTRATVGSPFSCFFGFLADDGADLQNGHSCGSSRSVASLEVKRGTSSPNQITQKHNRRIETWFGLPCTIPHSPKQGSENAAKAIPPKVCFAPAAFGILKDRSAESC